MLLCCHIRNPCNRSNVVIVMAFRISFVASVLPTFNVRWIPKSLRVFCRVSICSLLCNVNGLGPGAHRSHGFSSFRFFQIVVSLQKKRKEKEKKTCSTRSLPCRSRSASPRAKGCPPPIARPSSAHHAAWRRRWLRRILGSTAFFEEETTQLHLTWQKRILRFELHEHLNYVSKMS